MAPVQHVIMLIRTLIIRMVTRLFAPLILLFTVMRDEVKYCVTTLLVGCRSLWTGLWQKIQLYKNRLINLPNTTKVVNKQCACCFVEYDVNVMISCTTDPEHVICSTCLQSFAENCISEMRLVSCAMSHEGCKSFYPDDSVKKLLTPTNIEIYKKIRKIYQIHNLHLSTNNSHICPNCSQYLLVLNVGDPTTKFVCDECDVKFCIVCNSTVTECTCYDPNNTRKSIDESDVIRRVGAIIDRIVIHKCPVCGAKYIKDDGCNLITCSKCHSYSCYLCGLHIEPRGSVKYWHFVDSGSTQADATCRLYGEDGHSKKINDGIKTELKAFLRSTNERSRVKKIIRHELRSRGIEVPYSFQSSFCMIT
ncbi:hypothetical protein YASMINEVIRUS_457 [Yasminevirus sp. GU-2018]|uniref:RING-type domain-containing protein n=1 Tax=Yasminevirus sp. GU-2018 TaxID=2420051 RepID=A0A5K0U935_9VIRU|nr:hypothetical protein YASMINEVIRUS_457 [Yasminevirus sp. GU-2018]